MRCPTCGTENTPDSRFCGGCGAKLTPEQSRVAPTAKIPDDAPFPPSRPGASVPSYAQPTSLAPPSIAPPTYSPASIPPTNNPASIPPNTYQAPPYNTGPASIPPNTYQARPASIPPTNGPASIPPGVYQAPAEPSLSMPAVPRARWGLIILVLLMDLGLATAGAIMLQKGLAQPDAEPGRGSGSAKPMTTSAAAPASPPPVANAAAAPPLGASIEALAKTAPAETKDEPRDDKKAAPLAQANKPKIVKASGGGGGAPQDPYDDRKGLGAEIELAAARSRGDFDQCFQAAQGAMQMKSRIDIGFTILPDGRVAKVHVVANSTGVPALAACLSDAIGRWAFAEHPAKPTEFVRPFIYN